MTIGKDLLAVDIVPVQRATPGLGCLEEKEVSHPVSVTPGEGRNAEQGASNAADEVRVHPVTKNPAEDVLRKRVQQIYKDNFPSCSETVLQLSQLS